MFSRLLSAIIVSMFMMAGALAAPPPLEVYGSLPTLRSLAISPSGNRAAFLRQDGEREYAAVFDFTTGDYVAALDTVKIKASSISFVSDDFAIIRASKTGQIIGFKGEVEYWTSFSWNLEKNDVFQLLTNIKGMYPGQAGLGRIVGAEKDGGDDYAFMPAYMGKSSAVPSFDLLRVRLRNDKVTTHAGGVSTTKDWIVAGDGTVIAREDFDDEDDIYRIWMYQDGAPVKIYEEETDIPNVSLVGALKDKSALVVWVTLKDTKRDALVTLTPDGEFSEALFSRADADVDSVITDINRVVHGVRYSGLRPTYGFFDAEIAGHLEAVQAQFPQSAVYLTDWTDNFEHLVVRVEGGPRPPAYFKYSPAERRIAQLGAVYDGVSADQLAPVNVMRFPARDGQEIASILTLPPGGAVEGGYPTIIMPHGGPASYDSVGFDWMAQYFASRGYAVVQPNFRGSSGFGSEFELAGDGEWGRGIMQHDVSDAAAAAVKAGIADPDRMCIVGGSYGGYSALAGGAFTPELYKCVAAIAPVTDLPRMLIDEREDSGKDSWVISYWERVIGDLREEREKLENISPSNFADAFQAPVLLIHGNDDTVVPLVQSLIMERQLKSADKDVELVKLRGGDHWLTTNETRLETLRALDAFINEHIGQ